MLYERVDVYRRVSAQELIAYRCFRLTSGQGYVVQSADYLRLPSSDAQRFDHEKQFIELLLEQAPEERSPSFSTLEEAIQAFDQAFK